jgi:Uma2 family endonuclease
MSAPVTDQRRLSEAEYLRIERSAECKSEFFDGELFAMAGGTPQHSLIATNVARELGNALKGRPCVAYNSDLRLKIEATGLFTYPDVSVVCGPLALVPGTNDTFTNPTLLVEVLSDSTEAYDRGQKFVHYRQIPSLREYLLVSQKEPRLEHFGKRPDGWIFDEVAGTHAEVKLPSLDIILSLAEIFAHVEFVAGSIRKPIPPPLES